MMIQRWIDNGDKPATLQSKISMLRIFSVWIGKEGMIPPNEKLFRGREHLIRRTYVRKEDPRPEAKGVTREELLSRAAAADDRFALILECQLLFGMRREEAICFRPHLADRGSHITFFAQEVGKYTGTKNGVGRHVTVDTAEKRGLLERLKAAVPMGEPLGWHEGTEKGLQKSIKKYANLATRIGMTKREMGFTGHSLRATALVDSAMRDGLPVPVLGESAEGMSPEELDVKRRRLSNQAGHARPQITDAYIGAFVKGRKVASPSLDLFADTDGSANGGSADGEVDARRGEAGDQNQSPPV
jgi:integrase